MSWITNPGRDHPWPHRFSPSMVPVIYSAVSLTCFALYVVTSCLTVYTADNGELLTTAYLLGVPHPTGYPTFNLLGKLFTWFPFGGYPIRIAWLAAICTAFSVGNLFLIARRLLRHEYIAVWAAVLFGLCRLPWSQSVVGEVYGLHLLLCTGLLLAMFRFTERPDLRHAGLLGFIGSLAVTNHLLTSLCIPAMVVWVLTSIGWRRSLRLFHPVAVTPFLMGFGVYVYLPLRYAQTFIVQWGDLGKAYMLIKHLAGRQFYDVMFSDMTTGYLSENLFKFKQLTKEQFPWVILLLILIGMTSLFLRDRKWFTFLGLLLGVDVVFALNYYIVDIDVYYLQAYIAFCLFAGEGASRVVSWLQRGGATACRHRIAVVACLLLFLSLAVQQVRGRYYCDRSANFLAHDYGVNILYTLEHRSELLTQGWSSPFLYGYFQEVLHARPDVNVYIDNHGKKLQQYIARYQVLGPVYSNIHIDVMAARGESQEAFGLVYKIGQFPFHTFTSDSIWDHYRVRNFSNEPVFYDYHNRALRAMYHYMRGEYQLVRGDHERAREDFAASSRIGRFNAFIHNNLSCIFFREGWYPEAERECYLALELNPDFPQVKYNLANIFFMKGDRKAAMRMWDEVSETGYEATSYKAIATIYLEAGEYEKALDMLDKALFAEPGSAEIYNNMGIAYSYLGDISRSRASFRKAVQLDPAFPQAHNNLGTLELSVGNLEEAERSFRQAIKLEPGYLDARLNLAVIHGKAGRWEEAEKELTAILGEAPGNAKAMNNLGLLYLKTGRIEKAVGIWERSLGIDATQSHIQSALTELKGGGDGS
ncbi:tetratricopeptide repeat protein [bacterium]|nr:tetratricopeptide repeat protein [candidate division CSSED10-310 bacterium]